eukprot:GHVS01008754.1.p1 GENE.GHVS01008754.1~~GHVS01008754.1.p1  ORF type:complete len:299 (+),score=59.56 GHVS01008754.1:113-1009(+)
MSPPKRQEPIFYAPAERRGGVETPTKIVGGGKKDGTATTTRKRVVPKKMLREAEGCEASSDDSGLPEDDEEEEEVAHSGGGARTYGTTSGGGAGVCGIAQDYLMSSAKPCSLVSTFHLPVTKLCAWALTRTLNKQSKSFLLSAEEAEGYLPEQHQQEKLIIEHEKLAFLADDCLPLMRNGFNVLLHGCGSKYRLLRMFVENLRRRNCAVLEFEGFRHNMDFHRAIGSFMEGAFGVSTKAPGHKTNKLLHDFKRVLENEHPVYDSDNIMELFVVVHSIDGQSMRYRCPQIADLCSLPNS